MITICLYWFMVCLYVCIYVSKQGRHVIVFVSAHKDTTCTHNVPAPPPVGGLGGSYHLQPCIGIPIYVYIDLCMITICLYWFMVCLYVCMYVSKQGRHVIFIVYANKDTTYTHNVPAPPPVGGLGGSYHLQPCIGIQVVRSTYTYT